MTPTTLVFLVVASVAIAAGPISTSTSLPPSPPESHSSPSRDPSPPTPSESRSGVPPHPSGSRSGSGLGPHPDQRHIDIDIANGGAIFTTTDIDPRMDGSTNKTRFQIAPGTGGADPLGIQLDYFHDKKDAAPRARLGLAFVGMIEFTEQAATGFDGFTEGVDTVVQQIALRERALWQVQGLADETQTNGAVVNRLQAEFGNASHLHIRIVFRTSTTNFSVGGTDYPAGTLKIDIEVPAFPFKQTGSYLALIARIQGEIPVTAAGNQAKVQTPDGAVAEFAWLSNFDSDAGSGSVVASDFKGTAPETSIPGTHCKQAYFSFSLANALNIVWDPVLLASDPVDNVASGLAPFFILLALALFFL